MPRQHGSFDDAINHGAVIAEYHHNENNDNYTVYVKEAEGTLTPFTNIKKEHLQNLLPKAGVKAKRVEQTWKAPEVSEEEIGATRKSHAGLSFDECVREGGRIVDLHRVSCYVSCAST